MPVLEQEVIAKWRPVHLRKVLHECGPVSRRNEAYLGTASRSPALERKGK